MPDYRTLLRYGLTIAQYLSRMAYMTYRERSVSYTPLTVTQVSGLLGISRRTVLREIQRGNLAAVKPGGMYRIDPTDYAAYREKCQVIPTS